MASVRITRAIKACILITLPAERFTSESASVLYLYLFKVFVCQTNR